jgi:hypothetical protein
MMQFELNQATTMLAGTPAVLDAMLRHQSPAWLNARKAPEAFSPLDVLGHLIHAEKTDWIPRVRIILEHGESRAFEPFDRFGFHDLTAGKDVGQLLDLFASSRRECLQALSDLSVGEADLSLYGVHPEQGRVTMRELLAAWVVHDLGHIAQIVKTMAGEYREAVGSWRSYLSILD